ncbi:hypothetical protein [Ectopseudomonas khazarica]|uniref:hypothetical protein n=1 Tax=Ectopseudomonas khazarica TaxID=2502979 RepID=UPI00106E2A11|nr:hypothetical protein [Pseudomonas khazarica]
MTSYTTVASADTVRYAIDYTQQLSQEDLIVANKINAFVKQCRNMELETKAAIKEACAMSTAKLGSLLSDSEYAEMLGYIEQVRSTELKLKVVDVPDQFVLLHAELRRSLAKLRSSMVLLHDVTLQAMKAPVIVPGHADPEAIRALAAHTTRRLIELAKA